MVEGVNEINRLVNSATAEFASARSIVVRAFQVGLGKSEVPRDPLKLVADFEHSGWSLAGVRR